MLTFDSLYALGQRVSKWGLGTRPLLNTPETRCLFALVPASTRGMRRSTRLGAAETGGGRPPSQARPSRDQQTRTTTPPSPRVFVLETRLHNEDVIYVCG